MPAAAFFQALRYSGLYQCFQSIKRVSCIRHYQVVNNEEGIFVDLKKMILITTV